MTPTVTQSVLVYDRIAQNRRKTVFLVAIAILSIVPFIAGLSYLAAQWTLSQLGHHVISSDIDERLQKSLAAQPPPGSVRTEYDSAVEREIEADLAKIHRTRVENEILQWKVTIVFAFGLMGVLGLMFWSLASSPTSQVLAMWVRMPGSRTSDPEHPLSRMRRQLLPSTAESRSRRGCGESWRDRPRFRAPQHYRIRCERFRAAVGQPATSAAVRRCLS